MTPGELLMFVEGWNASHASNETEPPTADEVAELYRKYG